MTCFPGSLYAAFEVLIEPDFRTSHIVEINAFGELLPRLLHEDKTTYEFEVAEALVRKGVVVADTVNTTAISQVS